jgi:hypothetical protein
MQVKTKNHPAPANGLSSIVASPRNIILKKSSIVPAPLIISNTHEPPDKYITGNIASNFPSFGPVHRHNNISYLEKSKKIYLEI